MSLSTLRDDLALCCVEPLRSARIGTTTSRGSVLETGSWPVWLGERSADVPQL